MTKYSNQVVVAVAVVLLSAASTFACERTSYRYCTPYCRPVTVLQYSQPAPLVYQAPVALDPEVRTGSTLALVANFLGNETGYVLMRTSLTTHNIEIKKWSPAGVIVKLPEMGLDQPIFVQLDVVLPTGKIAKSTRVRLISQPTLFAIDEQPAAAAAIANFTPGASRHDAPTGGLSLQQITSDIQNASVR